jgi:hypothetical protein
MQKNSLPVIAERVFPRSLDPPPTFRTSASEQPDPEAPSLS